MSDHDQEPIDHLAILRAALDQALALAPELARTYRAYFEALQAVGFDDRQALYLTACQALQNPGTPPA